jgi:hypothetical protein
MWLEQTAWIWVPLAAGALIWISSRLLALGREVGRLQMRISQLERAESSKHATNTDRMTGAA